MKKLTCLPIIAIILFAACKPKEVDCVINAHKVPCYVAFKGYQAKDLDTIIRISYEQGSAFANRVRTDTFYFPNVYIAPNGTTYSSTTFTHMGTLNANADYEIIVPAMAKTYRLTNITYTNDTIVHFTAKKDCGTAAENPVYPQFVTVNTMSQPTSTLADNDSKWVLLVR